MQAMMKVITDPLGTPLFDGHMASAGLPVTAEMRRVDPFQGDSITDQVKVALCTEPGWLTATCHPVVNSSCFMFNVNFCILLGRYVRCLGFASAKVHADCSFAVCLHEIV